MKKSIVVALLILLVSVPVLANDISAVGYGNTKEEADKVALQNLYGSIFPVFVTYTATTSTSSTSSSFSSEAVSQFFGELTGFSFEAVSVPEAEKRSYKYGSKVILKDNASNLLFLTTKIKEAKEEVNYYYDKANTSAVEEKSNYLKKVLSSYLVFNNYKMVLIKLGHEQEIPEIGIDKTYNILQEEYNSALIDLENYYRNNQSGNNNRTTQELIALLSQNQEEQRIAQEKRNEALKQQQMLKEAELQEKKNQFIGSVIGSAVVVSGTSFEDFLSMYNDVQNSIKEFNRICDEYESMIASENKRIDNAIKDEAAAIRNRPYRTGQIAENGKPDSFAIEAREKDVSAMKDEKEKERVTIRRFIDSIMQPAIQDNYNLIISNVERISKTVFSDSVSKGGIKVKYNKYVLSDFAWNISVFSDYVSEIKHDINLYYKDLVGTNVGKESINDPVYLDNVDLYKLLLQTGDYWKSGNDIVIKFTVKVVQGGFLLIIDSLDLYTSGNSNPRRLVLTANKQINRSIKPEIRNISGYDWLKTSSVVSPLTATTANASTSTATTKASTSTTTASKGSTTNSSAKSTSSSKSSFGLMGNIGLTFPGPGFVCSLDLYAKFGTGFFGLGISPTFWSTGEKAYLLGTDLLCVLDYGAKKDKGFSFYSDFRIGFGKGGVSLSSTLLGCKDNSSSFIFGFGLKYSSLLQMGQAFISVGFYYGKKK